MLSSCALAALLAACGGSQSGLVPAARDASNTLPHHKTFNYTGSVQTFKVPSEVSKITVVARGAAGSGNPTAGGGAHGGRVFAVVPVTPGETLYVYVGGAGAAPAGGFNGGASGGEGGYGGGGSSDVREGGKSLRHRIIVAGGAGGSGGQGQYADGGSGGKGGGPTGGAGSQGSQTRYYGGAGGGGGTQKSGGLGGLRSYGSGGVGANGTRGAGGRGGGLTNYGYGGAGGGGGGGYYGGGGGACGNGFEYSGGGGGGGGGSSYVEHGAWRSRMWQGWKSPQSNGLVVFSWQ